MGGHGGVYYSLNAAPPKPILKKWASQTEKTQSKVKENGEGGGEESADPVVTLALRQVSTPVVTLSAVSIH